ncbi:photosystem II reaction center W protein, chloroplastic-like [Wolffia australiana]
MAAVAGSVTFLRTSAIHGSSPKAVVRGLPAISRARGGRMRCSAAPPRDFGAILLATAATATAGPALALVDERLSTEGTGLSLGISNNLLGWILLGVFGLIWSLYFVYTSSLDEDEDSGLSL